MSTQKEISVFLKTSNTIPIQKSWVFKEKVSREGPQIASGISEPKMDRLNQTLTGPDQKSYLNRSNFKPQE